MTYILPSHRQTISLDHTGYDISSGLENLSLDGLDRGYSDIELELIPEDKTLWCYLKPQARPSFTQAMLRDLHRMQRYIARLFAMQSADTGVPLQYFVLASRTPGIFNLGGDLTLFSEKIRAKDRQSLRRYAHSCVEAGYMNAVGYNEGVVTIGLAQGEALGGGWESLMSCDILIAEKRARFGLPEVLFNLFPGMGAHSFLVRRLGVVQADKLIRSGKVHTADELHAMGLVEMVVEDGQGVQAVREYIHRNASRHTAHSAMYRALRRVNPLTLEELRDIADIWVDTALQLNDGDLRRMAHLAAAQDRNRRRLSLVPAVAAE